MSNWVITGNNNSTYPPEIYVHDDIFELSDDEVDALLPDGLKVPGAIIYNTDYSIIKRRSFDGSWVFVKGGEE